MKSGKPLFFSYFLSMLSILIALSSCKPDNSKEKTDQSKTGQRALAPEEATGEYPYRRLSTYGFFGDELALLKPTGKLIPYRPASSLFTDYALKSRFVLIPEGSKARLVEDDIELPKGTILIKNFYYPDDFREAEGKRRIIETRLMIHEEKGWQAYPYIWNEEQTDAILKIVGGETEVKFIDRNGKDQVINYLVPNKNQCKSCHNKNEVLAPIGIQPKHLNNDFEFETGIENQLAFWFKTGKLDGFLGKDSHPSLINYEDQSQALRDRAMAYLDINCSHCHRAEGPASTSGLFLTFDQKDPLKLGINKTPVAAGKGSGKFKFDILPGYGDQSILTYRMNSTEVGGAMPELGRTTIHAEGVALIKDWINQMNE
jgi:uncharacterized repeat protein (TIGR03806 family)